jgi:hypothetical protein
MRIMAVLFVVAIATSCVGCSGHGTGPELYVPMPDADLGDAATGIDGMPYPSSNIGGQPRTDAHAGQIFPDLTLEGVHSVATLNTPEMISTAEFYDPQGLRYDLLHVMGIFMWCPHCNNETADIAQIAAWRTAHRVAVLQIAMEGYDGSTPGWSDLQKWVSDHQLDFPAVIDGQGAQLGQYFPVGSVPVNIVVNPRSMEILSVDIGEVGSVQTYEQGFLDHP